MTTVTTCPTCHGRKRFWRLLFGFLPWPAACPTCEGWGSVQPYRPGSQSYRSTSLWRPDPAPGPRPLVVDLYAAHPPAPTPQAASPEPRQPAPQGEADVDSPDADGPDADDSDAGDSAAGDTAAGDSDAGDTDAGDAGTAY